MRGDDLLSTIEAIHAAGLDATLWPQALTSIAGIVGGSAASIEVIDAQTLRHREMYSHGLPRADEIAYLEHFVELNVRLPFVAKQQLNELSWDYMILDEASMNRAPFYMEFMPRMNIRYFIGGIVLKTAAEFAGVCVHRTARSGHFQKRGIAAMRTLVPHVRQAFDVTRRLRHAGDTRGSLERTLDWLADGVALVGSDGGVVYANDMFQAIVGRNDGIRIKKNAIQFADPAAQAKVNAAIANAVRLRSNPPDRPAAADFTAARAADELSYLISVRPLLEKAVTRQPSQAIAIIFVRDPLARGAASAEALRETFGLTEAETALAQALQSGMTPADYARERALSLNTIYTHLRRLREKTGSSRMPELIHKLNELRSPLRVA